jgi:hypothetical protein
MVRQCKKNKLYNGEKRLIWNNFKGGSMSSNPEKSPENKEKPNYVPFIGVYEQDIQALAESVHPNETDKQENFKIRLKGSFEKALKPPAEQTVQQLWQYLVEKFCISQAIIEGMLQFFTQDAQTKEHKVIQIGQFMEGFEMKATNVADENNIVAREDLNKQTQTQLAALLAEIKAANPGKLPEFRHA